MSIFGTSTGNGRTHLGSYTAQASYRYETSSAGLDAEPTKVRERIQPPGLPDIKVCIGSIHGSKAPNPLSNSERMYHRDLAEFYDMLRGLVGGLGEHSNNHQRVNALLQIPLFREAQRARVITIEGGEKYSVYQVLPRLREYRDKLTEHQDLIDSPFGGGKPDFKYLKAVDTLLGILEKSKNQYKSVPVTKVLDGAPKVSLRERPSDHFLLQSIEVSCPSIVTRLATFGLVRGSVPSFRVFGEGRFQNTKSLNEVANVVVSECVRRGLETRDWAMYGGSHATYVATKEALTPK